MTSERRLLTSILKLTKTGPIVGTFISRDAGIPVQVGNEIMKKFHQKGLIQHRDNVIQASSNQRVNIAIQAIGSGADLERVCRFLEWTEFENIAAEAFEVNNFSVRRRFRFKWGGRRWEIDVLARREPLVICVDCKRWRHGWGRSAIAKAVEAQVERTQALTAALPLMHEEIKLLGWKRALLVPVVLSLISGPFKFHNDTPIVPILQIQNFLDEFPAHLEKLAHFTVSFK